MFWGMRLPSSIFTDEGIRQDHELSGNGDEDGLGGLSLCDENFTQREVGKRRPGVQVESFSHFGLRVVITSCHV